MDGEMDEMVVKVVDMIVQRRKELELTQRDLAGMIGRTQPIIAWLEQKKHVPNLDTLAKVCRALGLELVVRKARSQKKSTCVEIEQ